MLSGVTMQFAGTRRKPNAFNLLHQLRLMADGQEEFETVALSEPVTEKVQ